MRAAVTTSLCPRHPALWMCPMLSRGNESPVHSPCLSLAFLHSSHPGLVLRPILCSQPPQGKVFVITWTQVSLLRRFHGTDLFLNHCPASSLPTLSRMRKSVHHVLVISRFMFFCSSAAKHSLPQDSLSLNLPALATARPSPVACIHL